VAAGFAGVGGGGVGAGFESSVLIGVSLVQWGSSKIDAPRTPALFSGRYVPCDFSAFQGLNVFMQPVWRFLAVLIRSSHGSWPGIA